MRKQILLIILIVLFSTPSLAMADSPASVNASGEGAIVTGPDPYNLEKTKPMNGTISIKVNNMGDRGSPLQNIDELNVEAKFSTDKSVYQITITEPMINHINGKDPTWFGVVYNQPIHGDTNTGTNRLPEMEPDIALWGWANVYKDGKLIHSRAPAHIKVMKKMPLKGVTLLVDVESRSLPNTTDGYLHIHWPKIDEIVLPKKQKKLREGLGWSGLILLNLWFGWLAIREPLHENKNRS